MDMARGANMGMIMNQLPVLSSLLKNLSDEHSWQMHCGASTTSYRKGFIGTHRPCDIARDLYRIQGIENQDVGVMTEDSLPTFHHRFPTGKWHVNVWLDSGNVIGRRPNLAHRVEIALTKGLVKTIIGRFDILHRRRGCRRDRVTTS